MGKQEQFDDDCRLSQIASGVKTDINRGRIRERLQILESWKLDADEAELVLIHEYETYLKSLLDGDTTSDCHACNGVRFRTCQSCGEPVNSFGDHRAGSATPQLYPTRQDWRALKYGRGRD